MLLDAHLRFDPPMPKYGRGIVLTREFTLPFVPSDGMLIHSRVFDIGNKPEGIKLHDVVWDMDREIFVGHVESEYCEFPLEEIIEMIKIWTDRGWRFGSFRDSYALPAEPEENDDPDSDADDCTSVISAEFQRVADARMGSWNARGKEGSAVFRAIIRLMAETDASPATAYAMQKTGRCFYPEELEEKEAFGKRTPLPPERVAFLDKINEYISLSYSAQDKWREGTRRYKSIEELVTGKKPRRRNAKTATKE